MRTTHVILPSIQDTWSWLAVICYTLVGIGCGLYLASWVVSIATDGVKHFCEQPTLFGLFSVLTVFGGFLFVLIESGRPLRGVFAFMNVKHSWISRELTSLLVFATGAIGDVYYPSWGLKCLAVAGALMLLVAQGFILYRSEARAAWNVPLMPVLVVLSGVSSGSGVLLLSLGSSQATENALVLAAIVSGSNLMAWGVYLWWKCGGDFLSCTRKVRHPITVFVNICVVQLLPVGLLLSLIISEESIESKTILVIAGGSLLIMGGLIQKTSIIVGAGFKREVVLNV